MIMNNLILQAELLGSTGGIMDTVMMGIAGFFAATLFLGVMWGFLRGAKRSGIRLITSLVGCLLALLVTPIMSMMLLGMDLPVIGKPDAFMGDMMSGQTKAVPEQMMGMVGELIMGLAVVLVNLIMYFIMYFAFKWVSWIVYAVLAGILAPTKAPKAERKAAQQGGQMSPNPKRYRLAGAGIGLVNGFIFFAFIMIPVFGGFGAFNKIASYKVHTFNNVEVARTNAIMESASVASSTDGNATQVAATVSRMDANVTKPTTVEKTMSSMKDLNGQIQNSIIGKIAGITGVSLIGEMGTGYLTDVKTKSFNFNVVDLVVDGGKTTVDIMSIADSLNLSKNPLDSISDWKEKDYTIVQNCVNRIFGIKIISNVLSEDNMGDIADGLESKNAFKAADGVYKEDTGVMYDALTVFNARTLSHDINSLIEIAKIVFAKDPVTNENLYKELKQIFSKTSGKNTDWQDICDSLAVKIGADNWTDTKNSKLRRLTDTVFGTYLVQAVFDDSKSLSTLYKAPIKKQLKLEDDIEIKKTKTKWLGTDSVSADSAEMISKILNVAGVVANLANGGDILDNIANLESDEIDDLSAVLEKLTDSKGMGKATRAMIVKNLPSNMRNPEDAGYAPTGISYADKLLGDIVTKLKAPARQDGSLEPMGWNALLHTAQKICKLVAEIKEENGGSFSQEGLMNALKDGDKLNELLDLIKGDPMLSGVVYEMVNEMIDEMIDGLYETLGVTPDEENPAITLTVSDPDAMFTVIEIIAEGYDTVNGLFEELGGLDGGLTEDNIETILDALDLFDENGEVNPDSVFAQLVSLNDMEGVEIQIDLVTLFNVDAGDVGGIENAIDTFFASEDPNSQNSVWLAKFKTLFGFGGTTPGDED